jgi:hypothetical protein
LYFGAVLRNDTLVSGIIRDLPPHGSKIGSGAMSPTPYP